MILWPTWQVKNKQVMATALGTQVKSLEMLVAVDMKKLQSQFMCWSQSISESTTISDSHPKGCTIGTM